MYHLQCCTRRGRFLICRLIARVKHPSNTYKAGRGLLGVFPKVYKRMSIPCFLYYRKSKRSYTQERGLNVTHYHSIGNIQTANHIAPIDGVRPKRVTGVTIM